MTTIESEREQRRAVEALAQALYEAEDPGGIAWALSDRARALAVAGPTPTADGHVTPGPRWTEI